MNKSFNQIIKSNVRLTILSVIAVIMLVTGMSYALYPREDYNSTNQVITVGTFDANLSSTSGPITLSNIYPESEPSGSTYSFTIQDSGEYPINFTVYLTDATTSLKNSSNAYDAYTTFDSNYYSYINYKFDNGNTQNLGAVLSDGKFIIDTGILASGASETHTLQFWLSEFAPNEVIGSVLSLNVNMDATAVSSIQ